MTGHLDDALAQRYVDGALEAHEQERCEAHVLACDECRLVVGSYRALADALSGLAAPMPGDDFTAAVLSRIDAVERHAAWERRAAAAVVGAAAVVLAALFAAAGAAAWAPALSRWSTGLADALQAGAIAVDVAAPLVRALRLQIVVACGAATVPLLLALRRLAVREQPATVSA